ncbi:regulator of (H+)-ATPase in vacuolar membrane [Cladophialophora chaetospira]|uniref:Regulator of (H+)-ATPase in vacuolar membrane n=1 Tax=Cladophialophora chaetospira TaxID=386627 RepID=A0AA39CK13_9EURO|nr:regulator of (H+)-ATPase in vacuolar membrane [Cladophialophora chaetospira]
MRAILPGRPQSKRQALCTAHWDGLRLVAYISGNAAVILSGPHNILQTIYVDTVESLTAITFEESTGRIALCDNDHVYIYRPVGRDEGVLRWTQIHDLRNPDGVEVSSLSWGSTEELLLGGSRLVLWFISESNPPTITWNQALAYPTVLAYLSPDSSLVASVGQHDRLVKIWRRLSYEEDGTRFDVSYLPHPSTVTNLHWRKPWHLEQNLDNLLYTFCADNHVRAWTASDQQALTVLQQAGDIDMNASIQPRRLSASSISTRRYAFVIDSRDFSTATEKAVQSSNGKSTDHALEHLIEIANRTPEICIVLDGLGHMSIWGLENAGDKNKIPPSVFHISHVDGMNISVPQLNDSRLDYVQFCIFADGTTPSSLSILLHSFAGDIDWYDSRITHLFDTANRRDRVRLITSLAGAGAPVEKLVRNVAGNVMMSTADKGFASVWQLGDHESSASLLRRSTFNVGVDIKDAAILSQGRYAAILSTRGLELWDIREAKARRLAVLDLEGDQLPERITQSRLASSRALTSRVIVGYYPDHKVEAWEVLLPAKDPTKSNGYHEIIRSLGDVKLNAQNKFNSLVSICDNMNTGRNTLVPSEMNAPGYAAVLAKDCALEMVKSQEQTDSTKPLLVSDAFFETKILKPKMISASGHGKVVVVNANSTSLSIWDARTGSWEYEHELDGTDTVKTFAWAVSPQGAALVAFCLDYHIVVLGQTRQTYPERGPGWVDLRHIRIRDYTTHSVGDLCWLRSGDLVVGSGIQFFIFEGYATSHHNQHAVSLRDARSRAKSDETFAMMAMLNALIPVFHPVFLSVVATHSALEAAKSILNHLNRALKYFSEGEELSSFLDQSIYQILSPHESQETHEKPFYTNGLVNGDDEAMQLSDYASALKANLHKYRLWQITEAEQSLLIKQIEIFSKLEKHEQSVDPNGQRYLQALYSSGDEGVPWSAIAFASLSTSQEVLIDLVTRHYGGKLTWEAARESGLFCWLTDVEALRQQMENVGRSEFTKGEDRNPIDCSLYYLALHKKPVLLGLWRMSIGIREKENTMKLLSNNFNDPRWKAAALKNAYALLSKRRFHYAAAFFLLADSLWDAVNVCAHQLKDLQLAIAIARVYESEKQSAVLTQLVEQAIFPLAVQSDQGRWMASWAYSAMLNQKENAIQVLVHPVHKIVGRSLLEGNEEHEMIGSLSYAANDPLLTLLYTQLRALLVKQNLWHNVLGAQDEWAFVMRCMRQYLRMGCDVLALSLVRDWEFIPESAQKQVNEDVPIPSPGLQRRKTFYDLEKEEDEENRPRIVVQAEKKKPPPTQFVEPSADSLLDGFGF